VNNSKQILTKIAPLFLAAFFMLICIRVYEFSVFTEGIINYKTAYLSQGILLDFLFLLNVSSLFFVITFLVSLVHKKISIFIFHILLLSLLFFQFGVSYYFVLSQSPLDESVLYLSFSDLMAVIDLKHYLNFYVIALVIVAISFFYFLNFLFKKIKFKTLFSIILLVVGFITIPFNFYTSSKYDKTICINNRINYFLHGFSNYVQKSKLYKAEILPKDFAELNPNFYPSKVENEDYPFFHESQNASDFTSNFKLNKKNPPNIVLIIVESLNSYFVGDQPNEMVQLMPFLSDLSKKSLFFKNTLSTCERTYNVLPSTMASLPIAPERVSAMTIYPMPIQFGLPNLLKDSYYSRFYCGLYLSFTNMNGYMNFLKTDYLIDRWEPKYKKRNKDYFCDGDVFNQSFDDEKKHSTKKRKLDVFLTYNTHEPFIYPNKETYKKQVLSLLNTSKITNERKEHISKNAIKFGSYAYLDDQLKAYFKEASKKKEHQNTIYFIVGDHGSELCFFDNLSRFHTSLLVYSPLLKKPKVCNEIVSQLDIAPSIIGLLKNYPSLNLPEKNAFNGKPLDPNKKFSNNHFKVLKGNNTNLLAALYGKYYYDRDQLYTYNSSFKLKEIKNDPIRSKIKEQLAIYNKMSRYVYFQNKLIPPLYSNKFIEDLTLKPFFSFTDNKHEHTSQISEFTPLSKCPKIPTKSKIVYIKLNFEIITLNEMKYDDLPELIVTFNTNNKTDYYRGIRAVPSSTNMVNNKLNLVYKAEVQLKDFKYTKNTNFDYYIFNSKKKEYKVIKTSADVFVNY
jgi:lipoteichoic acid synthase